MEKFPGLNCLWLHPKRPRQKNGSPNTTMLWHQGMLKLRLSGQRKWLQMYRGQMLQGNAFR